MLGTCPECVLDAFAPASFLVRLLRWAEIGDSTLDHAPIGLWPGSVGIRALYFKIVIEWPCTSH